MGDILSYPCILEDCPKAGTFYIDRVAWSDHMKKDHGGTEQWVCRACSQKNIDVGFKNSADFIAHVEQIHSNGIKPHQIPVLLSA